MPVKWNVVSDLEAAKTTQIFSGGACNILNEKGELLRNSERDLINDWLTAKKVRIFDPQIHPDTHGVEYDYSVHHRLEIEARRAAHVNLYEISPHTFGGITSLEIAMDHYKYREPMVIYFSDGNAESDSVPAHSERGHPLFVPRAIFENDAAMNAHYNEFRKNGNNMRKYLMQFAYEMDTLTVTFNAEVRKNDIVITPNRIHAIEIFEAVMRAASGERVFVNFQGAPDTRDAKGYPMFIIPEDPPEIEKKMLLDQYVDEGNLLRRKIAQLIQISVYVRVAYTQKAVINALEEVLVLTGILKDGELVS